MLYVILDTLRFCITLDSNDLFNRVIYDIIMLGDEDNGWKPEPTKYCNLLSPRFFDN